jgi:hypothetical protein
MKYLKKFNNSDSYNSFKESEQFVLPNVSSIVETQSVEFSPYVPPVPKAGDIVFIKDGILNFVDYND